MGAESDRTVMRVLSWNLFHGRDRPPDPLLYTRRSKIWGHSERGVTHVQVNRSLLREFSAVIARDPWQVALLQEAPPRWLEPLCRAAGASGASVLTARFLGMALRGRLADLNPDLIGAWEGGSNQLLVRTPWRIESVERLTLAREPQRRRMIAARLRHPGGQRLAVANVHLSVHDRAQASREARLAATAASGWAGDGPLILGGDLNLRPASSPELFLALEREFGLKGPTAPNSIDHLLATGADPAVAPHMLVDSWREPPDPVTGLALRLSDHGSIAAEFAV